MGSLEIFMRPSMRSGTILEFGVLLASQRNGNVRMRVMKSPSSSLGSGCLHPMFCKQTLVRPYMALKSWFRESAVQKIRLRYSISTSLIMDVPRLIRTSPISWCNPILSPTCKAILLATHATCGLFVALK